MICWCFCIWSFINTWWSSPAAPSCYVKLSWFLWTVCQSWEVEASEPPTVLLFLPPLLLNPKLQTHAGLQLLQVPAGFCRFLQAEPEQPERHACEDGSVFSLFRTWQVFLSLLHLLQVFIQTNQEVQNVISTEQHGAAVVLTQISLYCLQTRV